MLRWLFLLLLLMHALIHLIGFVKAFEWIEMTQFTKTLPRWAGLVWLLATCMLLFSLIRYAFQQPDWIWWAWSGAFLSQLLIISAWSDARYGTLANVLIVIVALASWSEKHFEDTFRSDVQRSMQRIKNTQQSTPAIIPGTDHLPPAVARYLQLTESTHAPSIWNARITFEGRMRSKTRDWFFFTSEQYNFFDQPERFFFMKARMFGLPVAGYHRYQNGEASMLIKLLSIIPVVDLSSEELDQSETVTFFNDLCLMVPAALRETEVTWQSSAEQITATFQDGHHSIKAQLLFDEEGWLKNFISEDRYDVSGDQAKQLRFSTPVHGYDQIGDYTLMARGDAIWHYPDGPFTYGKFLVQKINYNVMELE